MIWQLIQLNRMWGFPLLFGMAGVVACAAGDNFTFWLLLLFGGVMAAIQENDLRFYRALPVELGDVLAARNLSLLMALWLPLTACALLLSLGAGSAMTGSDVVAFGSLLTLALLWHQTRTIHGRRPQGWLLTLILCLITVGFIAELVFPNALPTWPLWLAHIDIVSATLVALVCSLLTAAIWWSASRTAPPSFPIPSTETGTDGAAHRNRVWLTTGNPYIYGVLSLNSLWTLCFCAGAIIALRSSSGLSLMIFILILRPWDQIRRDIAWLSALPVRPSALQAAIVVPGFLAIGCGLLVGTLLPLEHLPWIRMERWLATVDLRTQILTTIHLIGVFLAMMIASMAEDWRALMRLPWRKFAIIGLTVPFGVAALDFHQEIVHWESAILPANLPAAVFISLVPLALLYAVNYALFRRLEFVDKPTAGARP